MQGVLGIRHRPHWGEVMGDFGMKGVFVMLIVIGAVGGGIVTSCVTVAVPWAWRHVKPAIHDATDDSASAGRGAK